jgi:hypothetical protein
VQPVVPPGSVVKSNNIMSASITGEKNSCLWKLNRQRVQEADLYEVCRFLRSKSRMYIKQKPHVQTKGVGHVLHPPQQQENSKEEEEQDQNLTPTSAEGRDDVEQTEGACH